MRIKKVFKDYSKIVGLWLSNEQEEARNKSGNFYFQGNKIYSYGSHFVIGCWIDIKINAEERPKRVIFLTTDTHSRTTSKHLQAVEYRIHGKYDFLIRVPEVVCFDMSNKVIYYGNLKKNFNYFENQINIFAILQYKAKIRDYSAEIKSVLKSMGDLVTIFNCKDLLSENQKIILEQLTDFNKKFFIDRISEEQKVLKESLKNEIADWKNGKTNFLSKCGYLRIINIQVTESSSVELIEASGGGHGYKLEIEKAKKLFDLIKKVIEGKENPICSDSIYMKGYKLLESLALTEINNYRIKGISKEGALKVGCQTFRYSEIKRIAKLKGWI